MTESSMSLDRLLKLVKMQDKFIMDKSALAADRLTEISKLELELGRVQSESSLLIEENKRLKAYCRSLPKERVAYCEEDLQKWWVGLCKECGWTGLSRDMEGGHAIADTGDHDDLLCPICHSSNVE